MSSVIVCCAVLVGTALGAGPAVRTAALDLDTALALAQDNDERPALALARAAEARAEYRLAWARLLPTLSLSGTYRRRAFEVTVPREDDDDAVFQAFNALAAEGRVDMRLLDASAIPDIQASSLRADASRHSAKEQARQLAFETAETFYAALAADRTLEAAERRLALAAATSSNAAARFDAGLAARSELNRTRLDEAEASQSLAEARRAHRLARISLGFLIGVEPRGPLTVPANPSPRSCTRGVRPDIEAARILVAAAERATWAPWLGLLPSIDLGASLRATNETGFQDRTFNWDIALTMTWVLYDAGERYGQAALREARAENARLVLAQLQRTAEVEVARASSDLEASLQILEEARTRARLAEENRDEVSARFEQGLASALEVTDAATAAFAAKVALEQARFEVAQAALALRSATGGWPTDA